MDTRSAMRNIRTNALNERFKQRYKVYRGQTSSSR